ncbi:MAG TPA: SDR family oxidoreductase, partial [Nannocystis sp.]
MQPRKIALITGTSSGIGLHAAVALARAGYTTVATMRDLGKAGPLRAAAAAAGVELELAPLDVTDLASITAAVAATLARHGRIDLLVNNAGAGFLGSLEHTSADDLQRVFAVNFFGTWEMTRAVLPAMRAAGAGRIIQVTSVGGVVGQPFNDAYCAAKFAVEGMVEALAPVVHGFGVDVTLFEPGAVASEFVANLGASLAAREAAVDDPYAPMIAAYLDRAGG